MASKNIFNVSEQSTSETCLPICLMALLRRKGLSVEDSEEMNILIEGIKFTKLDYSTGQLVYICNKYKVNIEQYIDFPIFHRILSKLTYPKNFKLISKKIDKIFLQQIVREMPVIIYIDKYYLDKIYHYSHFVILESLNDKYSIIFDPWDAKRKKITTQLLTRSIQSLRNKLKISPKLIRII